MSIKIGTVQLDNNDNSLENVLSELTQTATTLISDEIKKEALIYLQNFTSNFINNSKKFLKDNQNAINNYINGLKVKFPDYVEFHHNCIIYQKQVWNFLGQVLYTIILTDEKTAYIMDESSLSKEQMEQLFMSDIHRGQQSFRYTQSKQVYEKIDKVHKILLPKESWLSKTKKVKLTDKAQYRWKLGRKYMGNAGQIDEFALALTLQEIFQGSKISSWQKFKIAQNVDATAGRLWGDIQVPESSIQLAVKSVRNSAASISSDKSIVDLAENIQNVVDKPALLEMRLKDLLAKDIEQGSKIKGITIIKKIVNTTVDNSKKL